MNKLMYIFLSSNLFLPLFANESYKKEEIDKLFKMSLDELMSLKIVTANKSETLVQDTSSAIFVITSEDIRRSGLTSFAELMRLVPGFHVAALNTNHYSISSRGFNKTRANKLLVLIDGRSQYTQLYAGVFLGSTGLYLRRY